MLCFFNISVSEHPFPSLTVSCSIYQFTLLLAPTFYSFPFLSILHTQLFHWRKCCCTFLYLVLNALLLFSLLGINVSLPFPNISLLFPSLCLFLFHLTFISAAVTPTVSFLFNPNTSFHLSPSLDTSAASLLLSFHPPHFPDCQGLAWR